MVGTSIEPLHVLSFDIEDWFHIVDVPAIDDPSTWDSLESLVNRRTDEILASLDRHTTKATFFMLGWIADRHPALVRRIANAGHELGSHSFWHRRVYLLDEAEFRRDTMMSLDAIEAACGFRPRGYRAPSFSIVEGTEWAFDTLLDCGIEWDASLFPAPRGHGGYPCPDEPHLFRNLPSGRSIPQLPLGVMRAMGRGLCFSGGGYLRVLPLWIIERGFAQFNARGLPVVMYLHPRDFAPDCPRVTMPLSRKFKCYTGMKTTMPKLEALMKRHRFGPCGEVLRQRGLLGS
ncbi:MAG: polysaccharide deacetylase family protein [Planctomycetota bacterium]|nr:polysaccharide deacetylase family protein [Planctomycetota bacterium]